jgi:prevent-host-death family protein
MSITVSEAAENLLGLIAGVNNGGDAVWIARKGGNAVLISEREYRSLVEMQYLFSTSANGKWLSKSMEQAEKGEVHPLGDYFGQKR